jgi:hypothetical protein
LPKRKLIEDLAGLQTSRINREPEYLRLSNPGHSVGQILGTNQHVTSLLMLCSLILRARAPD